MNYLILNLLLIEVLTQTCSKGCTKCDPLDSNKCTECDKPLLIEAQKSTCICPIKGYFTDNQQKCTQCIVRCVTCFNPQSCTLCSEISDLRTLQCTCSERKYIGSDQTCQPCETLCASCTDAKTCMACADNYSLLDIITNQCFCNVGYYLNQNGDRCLACYDYCATCSKIVTCTTCKGGLVLDSGTCQCKQGEFMLTGQVQCTSCIAHCSTCVNYSECLTCQKFRQLDSLSNLCHCQPEYYEDFNTKNCESCAKICSECFGEKTACIRCKQDRLLVGFECICGSGRYLDILTAECQTCPFSCHTCLNSESCLTCHFGSGKSLSKTGTCICSEHQLDFNGTCKDNQIPIINQVDPILNASSYLQQNMYEQSTFTANQFIDLCQRFINFTHVETSLSFFRQSGLFYTLFNVQQINMLRFIDILPPLQQHVFECMLTRLSTHVYCPYWYQLISGIPMKNQTLYGMNVTQEFDDTTTTWKMFVNSNLSTLFVVFCWIELTIFTILLGLFIITNIFSEKINKPKLPLRQEYDELPIDERYQYIADYETYLSNLNNKFEVKFTNLIMYYVDSQFLTIMVSCFYQLRHPTFWNAGSLGIYSNTMACIFISIQIFLHARILQLQRIIYRDSQIFTNFLKLENFNHQQKEEINRVSQSLELNSVQYLSIALAWNRIDSGNGYIHYPVNLCKRYLHILIIVFLYEYAIIQLSILLFIQLCYIIYLMCFSSFSRPTFTIIYSILQTLMIGLYSVRIAEKIAFDDLWKNSLDFTDRPEQIDHYLMLGWISVAIDTTYFAMLIYLLLAKMVQTYKEYKLQQQENRKKQREDSMKYMIQLQELQILNNPPPPVNEVKVEVQQPSYIIKDAYQEKYTQILDQIPLIANEKATQIQSDQTRKKRVGDEQKQQGTQLQQGQESDQLDANPDWGQIFQVNLAVIRQFEENKEEQKDDSYKQLFD